jgi:DUF4097 and DUF4098 domain-containing protein YvlB
MKFSQKRNLSDGNQIIAKGGKISCDETDMKREFYERKSQNSKAVEKITINSDVADVNVVSSNVSEIEIIFSGKAQTNGNVSFSVKLEKKELKIDVSVDGNNFIGRLKIDVIMPKTRLAQLSISNVVGDVSIQNEGSITQKLDVESTSGNIDIRRGSRVEQMVLRTTTGSIHVDNTHGIEKMIVETSSGQVNIGKFVWSRNIDIQTVTGSIRMLGLGSEFIFTRSSTGKIEMCGSFYTKKLKIETNTGNITLEEGSSEELSIKTSNGKIKTNISCPQSEVSSVSGNIKMNFVAEKDLELKVSTELGSIAVEFANIKRMKLNARSTCGSVKNWHINSLWGYRANVDIFTVTGNIEIK